MALLVSLGGVHRPCIPKSFIFFRENFCCFLVLLLLSILIVTLFSLHVCTLVTGARRNEQLYAVSTVYTSAQWTKQLMTW